MKINHIKSLRNCSVFHNFSWPNELHPFAQFNLIYGWNGSGKTTISRVFRDLELRRSPNNGEVILSIDRQDTKGIDFPKTSVPVRVFNRDFVTENVFPIGGGDVPPILILGKESVHNQKRLEVLKAAYQSIEGLLQNAQREKHEAENLLDRHCISRGGVVKGLLRSTRNNIYNNYDKGNYKRRAQGMMEDGTTANYLLQDVERETLLSQHIATHKSAIEEVAYQAPDFGTLSNTVADLLAKTVVSQTLQSLGDDAETSQWVRAGLNLHKKLNASECLFCTQSLPVQRISALEEHFSAAYEELMRLIDQSIEDFNALTESLGAMKIPHRTQFHDHLVGKCETVTSEIENYCSQANAYLGSLVTALTKKRNDLLIPSLLTLCLRIPVACLCQMTLRSVG